MNGPVRYSQLAAGQLLATHPEYLVPSVVVMDGERVIDKAEAVRVYADDRSYQPKQRWSRAAARLSQIRLLGRIGTWGWVKALRRGPAKVLGWGWAQGVGRWLAARPLTAAVLSDLDPGRVRYATTLHVHDHRSATAHHVQVDDRAATCRLKAWHLLVAGGSAIPIPLVDLPATLLSFPLLAVDYLRARASGDAALVHALGSIARANTAMFVANWIPFAGTALATSILAFAAPAYRQFLAGKPTVAEMFSQHDSTARSHPHEGPPPVPAEDRLPPMN
jgi:hypothetical protein